MRYLLLLFFFVSKITYSQTENIKVPIDGTLIFSSKTAIVPLANEKTGGFSFLKVDKNDIEAHQIDEKGMVLKTVEANIPNKVGSFLDAIHLQDKLRLYFARKDNIGFMDVDFSTSEVQETIIEDVFDKKETLIGYYGTNNKFYAVSITEDSFISVYVFSEKEGFEKIEFISENDVLTEKYLSQKLFSKNSIINIFKMDEEGSLTLSLNPKKIYVSENKIIITVDYYTDEDGADHITDIIALDLKTRKISPYTVDFPKIDKQRRSKKEIKSHSYLKNDLLFQMVQTKQEVKVQVVDYKTNKILGSYNFDDTSMGNFTTPQNLKIPEYGIKDPDDITKSKKFLRRLYRGDAGIVAYEDQSNYTIKVGAIHIPESGHRMSTTNDSCEPIYTGSPVFAIVSISVLVGLTINDAVQANPPNYGTTNSLYLNEKELEEDFTSITVSKESFEVSGEKPILSVFERSRNHEESLQENRIRLVKPALFKIGGMYYFSYFSIKERSFLISKLSSN